jgi:hypothetical protein
MSDVPDGLPGRFVRVGSSSDLTHLLTGLEESDVEGLTRTRIPMGVGGAPVPAEYLVHESVLRSHGEFPCAGDGEALSFCRQIADEIATRFGIPAAEAVARINRHWSATLAGDGPRVWIVGQDLVYHETPEFWAHDIYYGPNSGWWLPGTTHTPLPPP